MLAFGLRVMAQYSLPIPILSNFCGKMVIRGDEYHLRRLANFPIAEEAATTFYPETSTYFYTAYLSWMLSSPAHIDLKNHVTLNNMNYAFAPERPVSWDGTFNMPTRALADRQSKHSAGLRFLN